MEPILTYPLSGRLFAAKALMIFCFLFFLLQVFSQTKKAPPDATSVTLTPVTGIVGGSVTLTAAVNISGGLGAVSGVSVTFFLGSPEVNVGAATTNASGVATLTISLTANGTLTGTPLIVGTYPIAASWNGSAGLAASSGTSSLTVNPAGVA